MRVSTSGSDVGIGAWDDGMGGGTWGGEAGTDTGAGADGGRGGVDAGFSCGLSWRIVSWKRHHGAKKITVRSVPTRAWTLQVSRLPWRSERKRLNR